MNNPNHNATQPIAAGCFEYLGSFSVCFTALAFLGPALIDKLDFMLSYVKMKSVAYHIISFNHAGNTAKVWYRRSFGQVRKITGRNLTDQDKAFWSFTAKIIVAQPFRALLVFRASKLVAARLFLSSCKFALKGSW